MRGRYPLGCVAPGAEYERVRDQILRGLGALTDDSGRRVFHSVQRREDVYRGPYVGEAPDLVAVCDRRFGIIFESLRRELRTPELFGPYEELGYTGTHDPAGIYLFAGPAAATLGEHRAFPIEATAPTLLHLLDVPVPEDHDEPVMTSVLRPDFLAAHPVRTAPPARRVVRRTRRLAVERGRGARRRASPRAGVLRMTKKCLSRFGSRAYSKACGPPRARRWLSCRSSSVACCAGHHGPVPSPTRR